MKEERYDLKSRSISVVYNPNPKLFFYVHVRKCIFVSAYKFHISLHTTCVSWAVFDFCNCFLFLGEQEKATKLRQKRKETRKKEKNVI